MLTLEHILRIGDIPERSRIKLLRHVPSEGTPQEAWTEGWLHEYERMHDADFRVPDYIVTLIPVDRNRVRFLWVKRVRRQFPRSELVPNPEYKFPTHYSHRGIALDLEIIRSFDELEGRLILEWNRPVRPYHQWYNKRKPMSVLQILSKGAVDRFPGYARTFLTFDQLKKIVDHPDENDDWTAALKAVSGIYLITNDKDQTAYVGKASGIAGLFGRWSDYVKTRGHGGNVELRDKIRKDPSYVHQLHWSILHVVPNDTPNHEIYELESLTKGGDWFGAGLDVPPRPPQAPECTHAFPTRPGTHSDLPPVPKP
jgi:hypothetical protein